MVVAGGDCRPRHCSPALHVALTAQPDCRLFIVLESWHRSPSPSSLHTTIACRLSGELGSESESVSGRDGGTAGTQQAGLLQCSRSLCKQDDEDLALGGSPLGHVQHLPLHTAGPGLPAGPVDWSHSSVRKRPRELWPVAVVLRQVISVVLG